MTTPTVTLAQRIRESGLTMRCSAGRRQEWHGSTVDSYRVELRLSGKTMRLEFHKGLGHNGSPPSLEEVLECVLDDTSALANSRTFEEFAADYGYDPDSRSAERTWKAMGDQARKLQGLLGADLDAWLYETEREV